MNEKKHLSHTSACPLQERIRRNMPVDLTFLLCIKKKDDGYVVLENDNNNVRDNKT